MLYGTDTWHMSGAHVFFINCSCMHRTTHTYTRNPYTIFAHTKTRYDVFNSQFLALLQFCHRSGSKTGAPSVASRSLRATMRPLPMQATTTTATFTITTSPAPVVLRRQKRKQPLSVRRTAIDHRAPHRRAISRAAVWLRQIRVPATSERLRHRSRAHRMQAAQQATVAMPTTMVTTTAVPATDSPAARLARRLEDPAIICITTTTITSTISMSTSNIISTINSSRRSPIQFTIITAYIISSTNSSRISTPIPTRI